MQVCYIQPQANFDHSSLDTKRNIDVASEPSKWPPQTHSAKVLITYTDPEIRL